MSDPVSSSQPSDVVLIVPPAPLNRSLTVKPPKNISLVLSVCGEALKTYGDQQVSAVKILVLLQHILIAVNKLTKLSEEDQKQLALDSIHWLIDHQKNLSDEEKNMLDLLSDTVFPQAIDILSTSESGCFSCFSKKSVPVQK
jgi:hypothetical protein